MMIRNLRSMFCVMLTMLFALSGFAQSTGKVEGFVKGKNGEALPGATVKVVGRNSNAITDANGKFNFTLPAGEYTLEVVYVGYNNGKIKVSVVAGSTASPTLNLTESVETTEVVVVGSRSRVNRSSTTTAVPVDIVSTKEIRNFAQADVSQMLTFAAPSFQSARQTISDGTDHIDPAGLRGLGPDQTLVLLNGKRRHNTALVNINGTVGRGSVGTDMNAIPAAAIERIEILRDGAAAQYGSDAIAGVINVVLKKKYKGLNIGVMGGQNMTNMPIAGQPSMSITDGVNKQVDIVGGFATEKFYFTGSFQYLSRTQSNRSGFDNIPLVYLGNGGAFPTAPTGVATDVWRKWLIDQDKALVASNKYDTRNIVAGNSASDNIGVFGNFGYKFTANTEAYATIGGSTRDGLASGFSRNPNSWNQQPVVTGGGRLYANGFLPQIATKINDYSILAGIKTATKNGWSFDLSNTYGENSLAFTIQNSGNASLAATANPQTKFEAGGIKFKQNTVNLDVSKKLDIQDGNFLNIAFGGELRNETYSIREGEVGSYINGGRTFAVPSITYTPTSQVVAISGGPSAPGSQVFPGFQPSDATNRKRSVSAVYTDLELTNDKLVFGFAGRLEKYNEENTSYNGSGFKLALKYNLLKNFAFRTSLNTGFRAPSLQQRYFQNQSTQFVAGLPTTVLTANNQNPIVRNAFGVQDLGPEYSFGYTFGLVGKLTPTTTFTIDAYNIAIDNRIVLGTQFSRSSNNTRIATILNAAGVPADVSSVQFWSNAVNTTTKGLDIVVTQTYKSGALNGNISLAANFNENKVTGFNSNPTIDAAINNPNKAGNPNADPSQDFQTLLFDRQQRARIETGQPQSKIVLTGTANYKKFSAMVRTVRFGEITNLNQLDPNVTNAAGVFFNDAAPQTDQTFSAKFITDLVFTYRFYKTCSISVGANNLFDIYPDQIFVDPRNSAANVYANPAGPTALSATPGQKTTGGYAAGRDLSNRGRFLFGANQFGFNGRFVYARLNIELGDLFSALK
ncbi:MAG: TonB-dependent receptor [Chitinophagaceae bacterium]